MRELPVSAYPWIINNRLRVHYLNDAKFETPAGVVDHFGAVQAQDYPGSLWALGLRVNDATGAAIERAIADRTILRTWPLRGTIHFVTPADARWMLQLSAARVMRGMAGRHRELGLDEASFASGRKALIRALEGGRRLERHAAYAVLEAAGVSTGGQRGIHILGRLALEGVLCIGPRQGKQPTFVLLDEWVPAGREMRREEALAELARRYFTSHGPATLADYTWWSGLTAAEARSGLEAVGKELAHEVLDGTTYWFGPAVGAPELPEPVAHLLPVYDEYTVAYKDRRAVLAPEYAARPDSGNGIFRPPILMNGQIAGTWTRSLKKSQVEISPNLFREPGKGEQEALHHAADSYGRFLGLAADLVDTNEGHKT